MCSGRKADVVFRAVVATAVVMVNTELYQCCLCSGRKAEVVFKAMVAAAVGVAMTLWLP